MIVVLSLLIFGIIVFLRRHQGNLPTLYLKTTGMIESSLRGLPARVAEFLPSDADGLKTVITSWLREHAGELYVSGKKAA